MAKQRKNLESIQTTGFGTQGSQSGRRFYRKDGSVNIIRRGLGFFDRMSWFHAMIAMPRWKFWSWLGISYIVINLIFAVVYYFIGVEYLVGVEGGSKISQFAESFFFSAQTFTTVGYGRISPTGLGASAVAAIEAFMGVLAFALASGLFYGRFAKPRAYLRFSDIALISPFKEGMALMFRTAPYKNNHLMDAEVNLTVGMRVKEGDKEFNRFFNLPVEYRKINSLVLNWTIVHPINEESPIFGMSLDDMKAANVEILVYIKAYDEGFANTVVARTSYTAHEIIEHARFKPMYRPSLSGDATILYMDRLNAFDML